MAGGAPKYRHLNRHSAHRQALLRNLVTSLFTHESISTTWHKAKEAQRLAEKLITLGKRNTEAARNKAQTVFYTPHELMPKLFGPLRERYQNRPGGYTRVLRIEPIKEDQAPSAILELVDGPKDMRLAMTAKTVARLKLTNERRERKGREKIEMNELTKLNVKKVTQFRSGGEKVLGLMVGRFKEWAIDKEKEMAMRERDDMDGGGDGDGKDEGDKGLGSGSRRRSRLLPPWEPRKEKVYHERSG
ncbi:MAG: hypothetical protein M1816_002900 [Peltula sp. TS41687]|nr:MAG: hypothetical protein M1816_002900 [Peltula sp. TS41687]